MPDLTDTHVDGFTLIELIVVTFLISLFLFISLPALQTDMLGNSLKSDTRKLVGLIRGVRELATREHQPYLILFDIPQKKIWYEKDIGQINSSLPTDPDENVLELKPDTLIRDIWKNSTGTSNEGTVELWISDRGYVDQTMIHLQNPDQDEITIRLQSISHDLEIIEGYAEMNKGLFE